MTPTERTLKKLRELGYECEVVEKWNSWTKTRKDLYGFADIIAVKPGRWILVQATSGSNVQSRVDKILSEPRYKTCKLAGAKILVVGWRQLVQRNKDGSKAKRKRWCPKVKRL